MPQRHRVTRFDWRLTARAQFIAILDSLRGQDVAPLAIGIQQQCDMRGAVRVVLDAFDLRSDAVLVATKIDQAIFLPRTAAMVTGRDAPEMIARTGLAL